MKENSRWMSMIPLGPDDFDSDDESIENHPFYTDSGAIQWSKDHPDLEEINLVPKGRLFPGLLLPVLHCCSMIDFFQFFIDSTILQHIVDCTNSRYEENLTIEELL
jgi:hypothetical protein